MKFRMSALIALLFVFIGSAAAEMPNGEFLEAKGASAAVILAHGRGGGPDGTVVGPLRRAITDNAGLHTLSLQMPTLDTKNFRDYAARFPDAYRALQSAVDYLSKEKGIKRIYVMGYSMGARMTTAFLATQPPPEVIGYIGVGILSGGDDPLDANISVRKLTVPVIDLYADETSSDLTSAENRKDLLSDRYKQVRIQGATHSFRGYDNVLSDAVVAWLKEREAR